MAESGNVYVYELKESANLKQAGSMAMQHKTREQTNFIDAEHCNRSENNPTMKHRHGIHLFYEIIFISALIYSKCYSGANTFRLSFVAATRAQRLRGVACAPMNLGYDI